MGNQRYSAFAVYIAVSDQFPVWSSELEEGNYDRHPLYFVAIKTGSMAFAFTGDVPCDVSLYSPVLTA